MVMVEMNYRDDPAGVFATDAHRCVLGHLSLPTESVGYTPAALHERIGGRFSVHPLDDPSHVDEILSDLEADGNVEHDASGRWRMTQQGFKRLTGPIANEPPEGTPVQGPANIVSSAPQLHDQSSSKPGPDSPQPFGAS